MEDDMREWMWSGSGALRVLGLIGLLLTAALAGCGSGGSGGVDPTRKYEVAVSYTDLDDFGQVFRMNQHLAISSLGHTFPDPPAFSQRGEDVTVTYVADSDGQVDLSRPKEVVVRYHGVPAGRYDLIAQWDWMSGGEIRSYNDIDEIVVDRNLNLVRPVQQDAIK